MHLDLAFIEKDRSLYVGILSINRSDRLIDSGFAHTGHTHDAASDDHIAGFLAKLGHNIFFKHWLHLTRRPGKDGEKLIVDLDQHARGRSVRIRQYLGAFDRVSLTFIYLRHFPAPAFETLTQFDRDLVVIYQLAAQRSS